MSDHAVRELAYQLWLDAGSPHCEDDRFWRQAERQLSPRKWFLRSGTLEAEGHGVLAEVVDMFLTHAHNQGKGLGELVIAKDSEDERDEGVRLQTIPNLQRLGFWN